MTKEQMNTTKEAIAVLRLAHEYFDQGCVLLKDVGWYTSAPGPAWACAYDAQTLNEKLIPALIEFLNECPDCGHALTDHHPRHGCDQELHDGEVSGVCGCRGE